MVEFIGTPAMPGDMAFADARLIQTTTIQCGMEPPIRLGPSAGGVIYLHLPNIASGAANTFAPYGIYGQVDRYGSTPANGDWVEWDIIIPIANMTVAPWVSLWASVCKGPNIGNYRFQIDGIDVVTSYSGYASAYSWGGVYANINLVAGLEYVGQKTAKHTLRVSVNSKHASSTGFYLLLGGIAVYQFESDG